MLAHRCTLRLMDVDGRRNPTAHPPSGSGRVRLPSNRGEHPGRAPGDRSARRRTRPSAPCRGADPRRSHRPRLGRPDPPPPPRQAGPGAARHRSRGAGRGAGRPPRRGVAARQCGERARARSDRPAPRPPPEPATAWWPAPRSARWSSSSRAPSPRSPSTAAGAWTWRRTPVRSRPRASRPPCSRRRTARWGRASRSPRSRRCARGGACRSSSTRRHPSVVTGSPVPTGRGRFRSRRRRRRLRWPADRAARRAHRHPLGSSRARDARPSTAVSTRPRGCRSPSPRRRPGNRPTAAHDAEERVGPRPGGAGAPGGGRRARRPGRRRPRATGSPTS